MSTLPTSTVPTAKPRGRKAVEEKLSLPLFVFTVAGMLALLVGALWLLAPENVWLAQWSAPWWAFLAVFLGMTVFNSFFEFFLHRYVMHKPVLSFLSHFYKQHTLHHSLTRITRRRTGKGREMPYVENIYPITTPEQHEASFFPWFMLPLFGLALTPMFALLTWMLPTFPWFSAGFAAIAGSLLLYEVFHAIEHWAFEKWAPLIESKRFGWIWRHIYSFHLRHHAVIDCNESVSGFFTFPLPDLVFGTWINPKSLYVDGGDWEPEDFVSPRPIAPIRWLDSWADRRVKAHRSKRQARRNLNP